MEQEFAAQIAAAEIPPDLKAAFSSYFQVFETLQQSLPLRLQHRFHSWLRQVLAEAADPAIQTHWWEIVLDLIAKAVEPLGEPGRALVVAGRQLAPHLVAHLGPYTEVTLREITADTAVIICRLSDTLTEPQKFMVAPNSFSLAQALFNKKAWYRAIYAGKAAVGFIMLWDDDEEPDYFLWRFMIAEPCQGRGYGAQAIQRLVEYVKTRPNARELGVSCELGPGSPEQFYIRQGFVSTGEFMNDELVLRLSLCSG
jgi:diamine N-acetyltransferase